MASSESESVSEFVRSQRMGVLSTVSVAVEGYPFGSVTPYVVDADGYLVILISTLAQHTKNVGADSRCSLTLLDNSADDPQAGARLTWIANARQLSGEASERAHARYLRFFPASAAFHKTHDFSYYGLFPVRHRFIGGFGDINWVEPEGLVLTNPLAESEAGILQHMNADHQTALKHYCQNVFGVEASSVQMVGVDGDGFDLLADEKLLRFRFEAPVADMGQAREALVALAQSAPAP